ncbi:hypothetical protein I3843_14G005900 [Carya illinoinensis]|uniref:Methyltransferase type 11 domain-containing protein n=1 Tax=Carya illinoinensis TaxID=32201 RepID=A0A922ADN1_CARIL|nr:hypothetical protein I3760_14G005800 [Carya illinoinensis]KAG6677011.1 hypothetical protein I3842_14G005800 [Carya illinoinensis]KAG7945767.1 hypothetical protein I3843_14G005900 [Carya illinoinensis]
MYRDTSSCNTYNYGDARYWDARYVQEGGSFDWYQRYTALRPFVRKYIPQLKYMQMDVRNMSFFPDESVDSVIDKGTLDSLMCSTDAPINSAQMLAEVSRLLKPGGIYMLITYGDPTVRMPHLSRPLYKWKTVLYIIPRPGFERPGSCSLTTKSYLEPVPTTEKGLLPADFVLEDPDSHFIYVCKKMDETELSNMPIFPLTNNVF